MWSCVNIAYCPCWTARADLDLSKMGAERDQPANCLYQESRIPKLGVDMSRDDVVQGHGGTLEHAGHLARYQTGLSMVVLDGGLYSLSIHPEMTAL